MNKTIKKDKRDFEVLDNCVMCNKATEYAQHVHVNKRIGYIQGAGQLCIDCNKEMNLKSNLF